MIEAIIILLILIHLGIFKGWFLALWIIEAVLVVLELILHVVEECIKHRR